MKRPVLAAAVVVLVAAGCGGVENEPNLAAAAAKTVDTGSSRIEISGTESEDGNSTDIDCAGEANYETKRLSMTCDYGGQSGMEIVAVGRDTYMRGDILGIGAGSEKWIKLTDESFADTFSPQGLLRMLRGASQRTERVGEDEIRGAETVRYRLEVDCDQAELLDCEGGTSQVDVWIDDDGLVRRIDVPRGSSPFSVEFFDFGVDVAVDAPSAHEVVGIDEWFAAKPCRLEAGSPLTGEDVSDAMRRHGLEVGEEDGCHADTVAVFYGQTADNTTDTLVNCSVQLTVVDDGITFELEGGRTKTVANVRCSAPKASADALDRIAADLERQIHK